MFGSNRINQATGLVTEAARHAGMGRYAKRERRSAGVCTTGQYELVHTAPVNKGYAKSVANYVFAGGYTVLPEEKMLGFADKVAERFAVTADKVEVKLHLLENGFPNLLTGVIHTGQEYQTASGERYELTHRFSEGFDGKKGYSHLFGAFRWVCSNGMYVGEKLWECSGKHSEQVTNLILPSVEALRSRFVDYCNAIEREKTTHLTGDEFRKGLYQVVNGRDLKDWDSFAIAKISDGEQAVEGDPQLPEGITWAATGRRQRTYTHGLTGETGTVNRINSVVDVISGCKVTEAFSPNGYGDRTLWDLRQHATWYTTHGINAQGKPISLKERDAAEQRATKVLL